MPDPQATLHPDAARTTCHDDVQTVGRARAPVIRAMANGSVEIDSDRLLQGHRELCIRHGNECYRLRHTRNDKLILTK